VANDFVKQVIVTHAHPDHVMAVPVFRQMFPEVSVLASAPAAKTLSIEKAVAFFRKMDAAFNDVFASAGSDAGQAVSPSSEESQIAIDRVVGEGDLIEVSEGVSFRVLETPGHSDCSLSFHEPNSNVLLISDATGYYLPDEDLLWPNYFTGYGAYVKSIERLAGIGAEILCLSHNAVIRGADDVADYFHNALAATEEYHQHILAKAKTGKSVREIAGPLGAAVYEKTGHLTVDFFQKNCALLVRNSLEHEGIELA
jgi:glyoxylase-like metal-dependent hydrolase (beta-lactamase superfamily II)